MRKSSRQQKTGDDRQLDLFSYRTDPKDDPQGRTGKGSLYGAELLSQLQEQRSQTTTILERVIDYGNLTTALQRVKQNAGRAGIDQMSIKELGKWLGSNLEELCTAILDESYQVSPVLKVEIPKANGGKRMLGIPTVKDRLIQQAIHQILSVYYEPRFSEHSYGFRPGRSAQQAVLQASEYVKSDKEWVVDIDLENFFDKINHDRLMQRLSKGIGDKRLLCLIRSYLKAGMLEGGLVSQRIAGTPQGGPLSPLLSNIVLDELDKELERRGHSFCRYADDCNIYVSSKKAGDRVMNSVVRFIEGKLKLKVNREKSAVRRCSDTKFLGYTLLEGGDIRVSDKSVKRLKDKIREITRRNRGVSFPQIIDELNRVIVGWTNYFCLANKWLATFRDIDGWVRRKLRCYRLKQSGRKFTTFKFLRSLGIAESTSWNVVMYSHGWWNMSSKMAVRNAMGIYWFAQQGLLSIQFRLEGKG
jgi:RNA-directed DNA polymerase